MASRMKVLQDQQVALQQEASKMLKAAEADGSRRLTDQERERFQAISAERELVAEELGIEAKAQEWEKYKAPVVPSGNEDTEQQAAERRGGAKIEGFTGPNAFGEMLQAVHRAAQPDGSIDRRLLAAATGMNEAVGSEGGFLVQMDQTRQIRDRIYADDYMLQNVTRIPLGAKSNGTKLLGVDETTLANGQIAGGIQAYWVAEAATKTATQPKFREMDLKLKKIAALLYLTDELIEDTVALQAWAEAKVPIALRRKAAKAIYSGTGAGMPKGLINSGAVITVDAEAGQAAGTVNWFNILAMWSRMYPPSQATAVWLVDPTVLTQLYSMYLPVGTGGVPVLQPVNVAAGQLYPTLMGRPVIPVEYNQLVGTKGDIVLVDPKQYLWIDKGDIQQASSIHVRFVNDETAMRFVWRVDGQLEWNSALTPDNSGPTQSPVVMLATR